MERQGWGWWNWWNMWLKWHCQLSRDDIVHNGPLVSEGKLGRTPSFHVLFVWINGFQEVGNCRLSRTSFESNLTGGKARTVQWGDTVLLLWAEGMGLMAKMKSVVEIRGVIYAIWILIMWYSDYVKYCHVLDKIMTYFRANCVVWSQGQKNCLNELQ